MTEPDPMVRVIAALSRRPEWELLRAHFYQLRSQHADSLIYGTQNELQDATSKGIIKGIDIFLRLEDEYLGDN